jgi:hypothetical protein
MEHHDGEAFEGASYEYDPFCCVKGEAPSEQLTNWMNYYHSTRLVDPQLVQQNRKSPQGAIHAAKD